MAAQAGVDIGDVTINNAAGSAAVPIQDGGNSLTVDATSLPLPTGAATSALQTQPGVDIGDVTINNTVYSPAHVDLVKAYGPAHTHTAWVTALGELTAQAPVRIIGTSFHGTALDPLFWATTGTTGAGATVAVAGSIATLTTGTAVGTANLSSVRKARFLFARQNKFRAATRFVTAGTTNNTRRIGMDDGTNGFGFVLDGAGTFGIYSRAGGTATDKYTGLNGDLGSTYSIDTNVHALEIVYFTMETVFFIDGQILHIDIPTTAPYCTNLTLPIKASNISSGTTSVPCVMEVWNATVVGLGLPNTVPTYAHISTTTTTTLKASAGRLHTIILSTKGNGTATIYDNTTAAAPILAVIDLAQAGSQYDYHCELSTGLTVVTTGAAPADLTVVFD